MTRTVSERENNERKGGGEERRETKEEGGREREVEIKRITLDSKGPGHWGLAGHCEDFSSYSQRNGKPLEGFKHMVI